MTALKPHLHLNSEMIMDAKYALLPGDPGRVPKIAERLEDSKQLAFNREYCTYIGKINGKSILVTSTGIGGPSTSIAVEELAQLGVNTYIRIGSTGAIQKRIGLRDVIITSGSVRLDGASVHYVPIEYPAVAHYQINNALLNASEELGIAAHVGVTVSSDTFYPGQERYDSHLGYVKRSLQGSMEEWQKLNALNYEMESATLLTMAGIFGHRAGCVLGVIVNRTEQEQIRSDIIKDAEENAINVAIGAIRKITSNE